MVLHKFPDHESNVESSVPKTDDLPINLSGIIAMILNGGGEES